MNPLRREPNYLAQVMKTMQEAIESIPRVRQGAFLRWLILRMVVKMVMVRTVTHVRSSVT